MNAKPQTLGEFYQLIKPKEPPERIYGWRNSQLSVARYFGGCTVEGEQYRISDFEDGQPLVRIDVFKRELKEKADRLKADRKAQKQAAQQAQGDLA